MCNEACEFRSSILIMTLKKPDPSFVLKKPKNSKKSQIPVKLTFNYVVCQVYN